MANQLVDELGTILRDAREAKGLTLSEVQSKIRIGARFLEALENGAFGELPTAVHVRGYLRNYARFLELDPNPLLERYELSQNHRPSPVAAGAQGSITPETPIPPRHDQPFFTSINVDLSRNGGRDHESSLRLVIIAALLIALALVANRFVPMILGLGDGAAPLSSDLTDAVSEIMSQEAAAAGDQGADAGQLPAGPGASGGQITATVTPVGAVSTGDDSIISTSRTNTTASLATVVPTRPALPATMETVRLRLEFTERVWLQVTIDGEVVFQGLAVKGDEPLEFEAQQEAKLLTGNAVGVYVTVNDVALGKLGGRAQVIEEVWQSTGG